MASAPQLLKTIFFTLGATDFSDDVIDVEVVSEAGDVLSVRTLDGVTHQDIAAESWSLRLRAIIDWDTTRPGLAYHLFNAKGTSEAFVFGDTTAAPQHLQISRMRVMEAQRPLLRAANDGISALIRATSRRPMSWICCGVRSVVVCWRTWKA